MLFLSRVLSPTKAPDSIKLFQEQLEQDSNGVGAYTGNHENCFCACDTSDIDLHILWREKELFRESEVGGLSALPTV